MAKRLDPTVAELRFLSSALKMIKKDESLIVDNKYKIFVDEMTSEDLEVLRDKIDTLANILHAQEVERELPSVPEGQDHGFGFVIQTTKGDVGYFNDVNIETPEDVKAVIDNIAEHTGGTFQYEGVIDYLAALREIGGGEIKIIN